MKLSEIPFGLTCGPAIPLWCERGVAPWWGIVVETLGLLWRGNLYGVSQYRLLSQLGIKYFHDVYCKLVCLPYLVCAAGVFSSFSLGFASAFRLGSSVRHSLFVESRGLPRMHYCNLYFSAGFAKFKISRFGGFRGWGRLHSLLFTKFVNPRKGLKTLTFEVLKYDMLITFRTFYRMFSSV